MGNDKTSWLNLDDDDDDDLSGRNRSVGFTESMPADGDAAATRHFETGIDALEMRTQFEPSTEKTEIYHAGLNERLSGSGAFDPMTDPIVGWLVIVQGPGIGKSVNLGAGMNTIGRDEGERVPLSFGDTLISGNDHLRIIYDDDNRAFFVAPGSGRNISRMNGQIIATTAQLENHALLELSKKTHVRFVAFCNEAFDWSDLAEKVG